MITLSSSQQKAADDFLDFMLDSTQTEMVISGFAGTGKSTLVEYILGAVQKQLKLYNVILGLPANQEMPVHVTATTNKAAKVIAEIAGTMPQTIYSLLGLKVEDDYRTGKQKITRVKGDVQIIEQALIVVDEAGFADEQLIRYLRETTFKCKILMIGDPYQLKPVGKDCPVFDSTLRHARLTEIIRNPGVIGQTAQLYRQAVETGQFPIIEPDGQYIVHCDGPSFQAMIDEAFSPPDLHDDACRVLAWTNGRVNQYNAYIREMRGMGSHFQEGEHVVTNSAICAKGIVIPTDGHCLITEVGSKHYKTFPDYWDHPIQGRYITLNNSIRIWVADNPLERHQLLKYMANRKAWADYFKVKNEWGDLRPIHASTVHKSQGSTYQKVFIDLADIGRCNIPTDVARMLYVAFSRPTDQVILYGNLPAKYGGIYVEESLSAAV